MSPGRLATQRISRWKFASDTVSEAFVVTALHVKPINQRMSRYIESLCGLQGYEILDQEPCNKLWEASESVDRTVASRLQHGTLKQFAGKQPFGIGDHSSARNGFNYVPANRLEGFYDQTLLPTNRRLV